MAWSLWVSVPSEDVGIAQVGWRFSSQINYTWVQPGPLCINEDEIQDNVSVDLTLRFASGYTINSWQIVWSGVKQETKTSADIQLYSDGAAVVMAEVTAKELPPPPPPADTSCYIGDNGAWVRAMAYIGSGGTWVPATARIGNGGNW